MRAGRPSFTAAAVAAARGVARVDPLAADLVDGWLGAVMRAAARGGTVGARVVNAATLGLVDHQELRTRAIDEALRAAVADGVRQVVVLGAGLDARAWRLRELEGAVVFEVDHPSTQAFKRARIGGRAPLAREVRFVAVDFARDELGGSLDRAGLDARAPTFWIWEGVVPYLPVEAVRATLAAIAARSAAGSRLAVTYGTPTASPLGPAFVRLAQAVFRVIGEPLVGLRTRGEMKDELQRAGWRVLSDSDPQEWSARLGEGRRRTLLVEERLAVAALTGAPARA